MKIDKNWYPGVIKYLHKQVLAPKDIHAKMVTILGNIALSYATVKGG